jgi:hypothetical protein
LHHALHHGQHGIAMALAQHLADDIAQRHDLLRHRLGPPSFVRNYERTTAVVSHSSRRRIYTNSRDVTWDALLERMPKRTGGGVFLPEAVVRRDRW